MSKQGGKCLNGAHTHTHTHTHTEPNLLCAASWGTNATSAVAFSVAFVSTLTVLLMSFSGHSVTDVTSAAFGAFLDGDGGNGSTSALDLSNEVFVVKLDTSPEVIAAPAPPRPQQKSRLHKRKLPADEPETEPNENLADTLSAVLKDNNVRVDNRESLGSLAKAMGLKVGVQVGQDDYGDFPQNFLSQWSTFANETVVFLERDAWLHNHAYGRVIDRFPGRVQFFMEKPDVVALHAFADNSVDIIFLDAMHDYCATQADIKSWWPKLKVGGIFSGDHYPDLRSSKGNPLHRWCSNFEEKWRGVKGAVVDFVNGCDKCSSKVYLSPGQDVYFMQKLK